jgi:tetratricopeptide (TPR) repeat protein
MRRSRSWLAALLAALIVAATLTTYWPVTGQGFLNIDDNTYVADNPRVREGLTWRGLVWAFSSDASRATWHPVTWISHQIDVSLFGLAPGRHHLVSLLLHAANALLLLLLLRDLTGALWPSALVAALFALHPLHVESVAWIAERKDVLSTLLLLLSLHAWTRHVRRRGFAAALAAAVLFALSLMAKPMGVTFPFVLLLLDWWPLGRWRLPQRQARGAGPAGATAVGAAGPLLREKLPLFALAALAAVIAIATQSSAGAIGTAEVLGFPVRAANAVVSYVAYLAKTAWPSRLAIYYPHPGASLPLWQAALAALLLAAVTALALRQARRRPWLATGWLWYVGTLVPVIGLVQVGAQSMADRYTYLPLVGAFVAVAWEVAGLVAAHPRLRAGAATIAALAVAALIVLTRGQVELWRDNRTLFAHALAVTSGNFQAHIGLGIALSKEGNREDAIANYREALRLRPQFPAALVNVAAELAALGRLEEAERYAREAADLEPGRATTLNSLGSIVERRGRSAEAIALFEAAVRLDPDLGLAHNNLGLAFAQTGRQREAEQQFRRALQLSPELAAAHNNLALTLEESGRAREAVEEYLEALRLEPDSSEFNNNLGVALAGLGDLRRAAEHFERAVRLDSSNASARRNLDNAARMLGARQTPAGAR